MIQQIVTYDDYSAPEINGVLNFRPENVVAFHKGKNKECGTVDLWLIGCPVSYRVKYVDLKTIMDKE